MWKGSVSVAKRDVEGIAQILIDSEMNMFRGLETPVIFLQNVVCDLLLGLGYKDGFRIFADHVRRKYNAEAGFITMNLPRLLDVLDELGVDNPIICSNINKIGFRMCGGIDLYEKTIATRKFRPIAMSVLASGALRPREAIEYVARQKKIESIVFGASSRANIKQTKQLINELSAAN
jgi:phosphoribosylformimino-5-aminoimidazole carboxamide ribonucleotide (ProFAR) isomerase